MLPDLVDDNDEDVVEDGVVSEVSSLGGFFGASLEIVTSS